MNIAADTLLPIKKWWDSIRSTLCQSLSKNKTWKPCKETKEENYYINKFLLLPDTHYKYATAKEDFEAFSRSLRVNFVKDTNISLSKAPKSYVKLFTYMYYGNLFEMFIAVVFSMSPQLGGLGPKSQDLVIHFRLGEGEPLPDFHLRALTIISELVLMRNKTGQINNPTEKYIMELSKLKYLQKYMTPFEL